LIVTGRKGIYECARCHLPLFDSTRKYSAGDGFHSFWQPIKPDRVKLNVDRTTNTTKTSVECAQCNAQLGHVYNDGPMPTGLRYSLKLTALQLIKD
jgi:peptide-methionine (R)-S-oxide reductase